MLIYLPSLSLSLSPTLSLSLSLSVVMACGPQFLRGHEEGIHPHNLEGAFQPSL